MTSNLEPGVLHLIRSGALMDWMALPPIQTVVDRVRNAPNTTDKLDVRNVLKIPAGEDLVKCDTMTFSDRSTLMLLGNQHPYLAIAAKRLVLDIVNPSFQAQITRPLGADEATLLAQIDAPNGSAGTHGREGVGEVGRNGNPGSPGGQGTDGGDGATLGLPPLFLFIKEVRFGAAADPNRRYLDINWNGYRGGNGGQGGLGGNGGRGARGKEGATSAFDCKDGPGRGGRGGDAGRGGAGGDAGSGSEGGYVFLFAPQSSMFDFATANVEGGPAGTPGFGGRSGRAGSGGQGGPRNGWCGTGPDGADGVQPTPAPRGAVGSPGARGRQFVFSRDIF